MVNELYHHGILGQRWGVRRFQNKDGTRIISRNQESERKNRAKYDRAVKQIDKQYKKIASKKSETTAILDDLAKTNSKVAAIKEKYGDDPEEYLYRTLEEVNDDRLNKAVREDDARSLGLDRFKEQESRRLQSEIYGVKNPDGSFTPHGNEKEFKDIKSIYDTLDESDRLKVRSSDADPGNYTDYKSHKYDTLNTFTLTKNGEALSTLIAESKTGDKEGSYLVVMTKKGESGKGYASSVVDSGLKWLKESGYKRAYWETSVSNKASSSIAVKKGFRFVNHSYTYNDRGELVPFNSMYIKDL